VVLSAMIAGHRGAERRARRPRHHRPLDGSITDTARKGAGEGSPHQPERPGAAARQRGDGQGGRGDLRGRRGQRTSTEAAGGIIEDQKTAAVARDRPPPTPGAASNLVWSCSASVRRIPACGS
jgi:hypothetical protein